MLSELLIRERLEAIEKDIGQRQKDGVSAAEEYHRAKRDFEKAWADAYLLTDGTVEERKNKTVQRLWKSDAYRVLVAAEAQYEGWKAAMRALETRASIGQSLLRAETRDGYQASQRVPEPEWSGA